MKNYLNYADAFVALKEICVSRMNFKYFNFSVWIEVNLKKTCKALLQELIDSKQASSQINVAHSKSLINLFESSNLRRIICEV